MSDKLDEAHHAEVFFEVPQGVSNFGLEVDWRSGDDVTLTFLSDHVSFEIGRRPIE